MTLRERVRRLGYEFKEFSNGQVKIEGYAPMSVVEAIEFVEKMESRAIARQ